MYPPSSPVPGPAPAPAPAAPDAGCVTGPPPALGAVAPPVPSDTRTTGSGSVARGRSTGGSSIAMRRSADRSASGTWGVRATSTRAGAPGDSRKKFTASGAAARGPPPAGARAWMTSAPITPACTRTAITAPGATPREGSGRRSPGSGGRASEREFTVPGGYPETNVGAQHAAPLRIPDPCPGSRAGLFLGLLRRRETDHLDARAVRDVHRLHHVQILAVRCRLDEDQLARPRVVNLMERLVELVNAVRLAIDRIRAVGLELEHDLTRLLLLLLGLLLGRDLNIECLARQGLRGHEDDQQDEQHIDQRRDVDLGAEPLTPAGGSHRHGSVLLFLRERLLLLGDGADDAHACPAGDLDGLLHAAEFDVLVGLQKQNLVLGAARVDGLKTLRE